MSAAPETAPPRSDRFPPGIPHIVGNEIAERFSYYGMRAILYTYLIALYLQFLPQSAVSADQVKQAESQALALTHRFYAGAYAFPMIGAILADRLLGKYPLILWVSLLYCVGHGLLAVAGRHEWGVYAGLLCLAMGAGGIKPCVSANVGDQFTAANGHLVAKIYQLFYVSINYGSFFSTLLTPWLYDRWGPEIAFGVPGVLMALATFVFWLGRKRFVKLPPSPGGKRGFLDSIASICLFMAFAVVVFGPEGYPWSKTVSAAGFLVVWLVLFYVRQRIEPDAGFISVSLYSLLHQHLRQPGMGFFDVARQNFGALAAEGPPAVLRIMLVFSMITVFWALFDQHSTTWVNQAGQMDLSVTLPSWVKLAIVPYVSVLAGYGGLWMLLWVANTSIPRAVHRVVIAAAVALPLAVAGLSYFKPSWTTIELKAAQIQSLNAFFVIVTIPLLNLCIFGPLERRGLVFTILQKMTAGMFITALSFVAAAVLQVRIEALAVSGARVNVGWQVVQFLLLTIGEVLVSAIGLEFAYSQAPPSMKSTIMGMWFLCITIGNELVVKLAPRLIDLPLSQFFWTFAGLMAAAAVVFAVLAHFYKGKSYLQEAAAGGAPGTDEGG